MRNKHGGNRNGEAFILKPIELKGHSRIPKHSIPRTASAFFSLLFVSFVVPAALSVRHVESTRRVVGKVLMHYALVLPLSIVLFRLYSKRFLHEGKCFFVCDQNCRLDTLRCIEPWKKGSEETLAVHRHKKAQGFWSVTKETCTSSTTPLNKFFQKLDEL